MEEASVVVRRKREKMNVKIVGVNADPVVHAQVKAELSRLSGQRPDVSAWFRKMELKWLEEQKPA